MGEKGREGVWEEGVGSVWGGCFGEGRRGGGRGCLGGGERVLGVREGEEGGREREEGRGGRTGVWTPHSTHTPNTHTPNTHTPNTHHPERTPPRTHTTPNTHHPEHTSIFNHNWKLSVVLSARQKKDANCGRRPCSEVSAFQAGGQIA